MASQENSTKQRRVNTYSLQTIPKIEEEGKLQIHFMKPALP